MDWNLFWTGFGAVGGGFGAFAGLAALFQARKANAISQQAGRAAQEANRIAADSNGLAEHANDLARKANQISEDANLISQRALAVTADQTVYKWRVEFDGDLSTVFIVNDCPHEARDVEAFIRLEDETAAHGHVEKTPPFGEIALKDGLFTQKIVEDQRAIDGVNSSGRGVFILDAGSCDVTVHIAYTTELGSRRSDEIKQRLTNGKRH